MHSSSQNQIETASTATTDPAQASIGLPDLDTLGSQVLELASTLQTTLDVEQQINLFTQGVRQHVPVDGVEYSNRERGKGLSIGNQASHQANYELQLESTSLGSLRFFREQPFTGRELKQLENLLCGLMYPLRNALSYLEALQLASHDPLTGVQNRLSLQHSLDREVELAQRQQAPLSMLLADADHFKRYNDEYGHAFGDDVLRALAQTIAATVRRSDLLFRYGGEEFVILASHTALEGAQLLAERIRHAIAGIGTIRGRQLSLSVSIGVAQLAEDESGDALFQRVDDAMYQAKAGGRNRVVAAD